MRVLLLGATGNLGLRLLPSLLVQHHAVAVLVRSSAKLRSLISPRVFDNVTVYEGDIFDAQALDNALEQHECDAIINTAHNNIARPWKEFQPDGIVASVSAAAVRAGKRLGKPLRAWFIGGLGCLEYPGTGGWKIEDYMPLWMTRQHRETAGILKAIPTSELQWSLLCVAMMRSDSQQIDILSHPREHGLVVGVRSPPAWEDHWVRYIPYVGVYLNLYPTIRNYATKLENVADLIAENMTASRSAHLTGELVGMREGVKSKQV